MEDEESLLLALPAEMIDYILGFLRGKDVCRASMTCTSLAAFVKNDTLWNGILKHSFGTKGPDIPEYTKFATHFDQADYLVTSNASAVWRDRYASRYTIWRKYRTDHQYQLSLLVIWHGNLSLFARVLKKVLRRKSIGDLLSQFVHRTRTLPSLACESGNLKLIKHLLSTEKNMHKALSESASHGFVYAGIISDRTSVKISTYLLDNHAESLSSYVVKDALLLAIERNYPKTLELLLTHKAAALDCGVVEVAEAIAHATTCHKHEVLVYLLSVYPSILARTKPTLNATQQAERKVEDAIEEACGFGSLEFLETLLVAKMGNCSQTRFIERAIANNNLQVVQLLLRKTKPQLNPTNPSSTPLKKAASHCSLDIIKELVKYGADPYPDPPATGDQDVNSPFVIALKENRDPNVAEYLRTLPSLQQQQAQFVMKCAFLALGLALIVAIWFTW